MKIKNMKLMLLGLLALGSVNAFAANNFAKAKDNLVYKVVSETDATVNFAGVSNGAPATFTAVTINPTVVLLDDAGVEKTYQVVGFEPSWGNANPAIGSGTTLATKSVADIESLNVTLPIVNENGTEWTAFITEVNKMTALKSFKAIGKKVATLNAFTTLANLETLDLSDISNDGLGISLADNFLQNKAHLKTVTLPANEDIVVGANAFEGIQGTDATTTNATAVNIVNFANITEFGASSFQDAYVPSVTFGSKVTAIGTDAFKAATTNKDYLNTVVFDGTDITEIPAAFAGQSKLTSITVISDKITSIAANAFDDAKSYSVTDPITGVTTNYYVSLDLSQASELASGVKGAFNANAKFNSVKLAGTKLAGDKLFDIIDLSGSNTTLATLTLPAGLKGFATGELAGFTALSAIDLSNTAVTKIPNNTFNGCTALATLIMNPNITEIGEFAFYQTSLAAINLGAGVTTIKKYAFADIFGGALTTDASGKLFHKAVTLTLNSALATLGEGVFANTNITGELDFSTTNVYAIPAAAFAKGVTIATTYTLPTTYTAWYGTATNYNEQYFLTKVTLKEGTTTNKASIGADAFFNNICAGKSLQTIEGLNQENLNSIGANAFAYTDITALDMADVPKTAINGTFQNMPNLAEVALPTTTTDIADKLFEGDNKLATVNFTDLADLATIGNSAFDGNVIVDLDLSQNKKLTSIGVCAFQTYIPWVSGKLDYTQSKLKTITFPVEENTTTDASKNTNKINSIGAYAFYAARNLEEINNLKDTKITTLPELFSNVSTLGSADIDHKASAFVANEDQTGDRTPDKLASIELPATLTTINDYALQGLGIEEIEIPSSVTNFGGCVLQGNLKLKKFEWNDAAPTGLHIYTFRGCQNLEEVYFMSKTVMAASGLTDEHFYMSNNIVKVFVTEESKNVLIAAGYTDANCKWSTLTDEIVKKIQFKAGGESGDYYYTQYFNTDYSTWFDAENYELFSAVINGNKVEMVPAEVKDGYYKLKRATLAGTGEVSNPEEAIAIVRVKKEAVDEKLQADVLYQAVGGNDQTTLDTSKNQLQSAPTAGKSAGKLNFFYKFGNHKTKGLGFYRITSGTLAAGTIYIQAPDMARLTDFLGLSFGDDDATAIEGVEAIEAENGAEVYNLQGVRVNGTLQKGIYVKNGKKFIVK